MAVRRFILLCLLLCLGGQALADNEAILKTLRFTAPKKWALVIGAQQYKSMGALSYTINDATEFAQTLQDDLGFDQQHLTLLIDGGKAEQSPTASNILKNLDRLLADKQLDRGDLFIFYFAGHGVGTKKGDYLAPTDATMENVTEVGVPVREITKRFVDAGLKNVLIIADACRSGAANPFGEELEQLGNKSNLAVLLATAPGKRSYELAAQNHGAFTYSLIKNIKDPALRDEVTGGLWATDLAQHVAEDTFKLTEPKYGKYAQKPISWNEKRLDVLLASFAPTRPLESKAMEIAFETRGGRSTAAFTAGLHSLAILFSEQNRYEQAIKILQTLDGVGMATTRPLLLLAEDLRLSGRDADAARVYDRILEDKNEYFRANAIYNYPGSRFSPEEKSKAANTMWQYDGDFFSSVLAYESATNSTEAFARATKFASGTAAESKAGLYWQGILAEGQDDRESAKKLFDASANAEGDEEITHYALMHLLKVTQGKDTEMAELRIALRGAKLKNHIIFWDLQVAEYLGRNKRYEEQLKLLGSLVVICVRDGTGMLLEIMDTARSRAGQLLPKFDLLKKVYPNSAEVYAAEYLGKLADHFDLSVPIPPQVDKFAEDPVTLRSDIFRSIERLNGEQPTPVKDPQLFRFFLDNMAPVSPLFDTDALLWGRLCDWSIPANRTLQVYRIAEQRLFPKVLAGEATSDAMSWALTIAENAGQDAMAAKIYKVFAKEPVDQYSGGWKYLVYLITRGKNDEARGLLPTMRPPTDWVGPGIAKIVPAYFEALDGKSDARKLLDDNQPDYPESTFIWIMANDILGEHVRTESFFTSVATSETAFSPNLRALALDWLLQRELKKKDSEVAPLLAYLCAQFAGNPLLSEASYVPNPKLGDYVGKTAFQAECVKAVGSPSVEGDQFAVEIMGGGKFTASGTNLSITGVLDKWGNVTGAGTCEGKPVTFSAKWAPKEAFASNSALKSNGQTLVLFGATGAQTVLILKPAT